MYALLKSKSEQERRLLTALVNKVSLINICNFYKLKFISLGLCSCEFEKCTKYCFTFFFLWHGLQLGDPDNKAASNADFYLTNLLSDHPNMKVKLFITFVSCIPLFDFLSE